jgi:serine/threonine protein kinase
MNAHEPATGAMAATAELGGQWIRDMRRAWQEGRPIRAEDFIHRLTGLNPDEKNSIAVDLVYEEYCLRTARPDAEDHQALESELKQRFPQWSEALGVMFACHDRLLQPAAGTRWPVVGESVANFRLTAELGKGAQGRVFLARQDDLAERPVVIKIIPVDGHEHLSLARLQHTHIVPVYSVTEDFERDLRILCMPYFGRSTFATLFNRLANVPIAQRTAQSLIAVLDEESQDSLQTNGMRQVFERLSYTQVLCCIMAAVADALHFAHERDLVHFDLKPSNLLLTRDCHPMLLDFHLARPPIPAQTLPDRFGGSAPYMAPEQMICFRAVERGEVIPLPLDRRADIYAIGQVLIEALTGFPHTPQRSALDDIQRLHGTGLHDICAKCIVDTPRQRYATAAALAEDLRRHAADLPLLGVRNRNLPERFQKWKRRHGRHLWKWAFAALVVCAIGLCAWFFHHGIRQVNAAATAAMQDGDHFLSSGLPDEAIAAYTRGIDQTNAIGLAAAHATLLNRLAIAQHAQLAAQLKQVSQDLREFYASGLPEGVQRDQFLDTCQALWNQRNDIRQALAGSAVENSAALTSHLDAVDAAEFQDLALFLAANRPQSAPAVLAAARAEFGDNAALRYMDARLRDPQSAAPTAPPADASAWERCAIGRDLLLRGINAHAQTFLTQAVALNPADFWSNFYLSVALERLRRYSEEIPCLSVCIGSKPDSADAFLRRAIAWDELGQPAMAITDDDQAARLAPQSVPAAMHRGSVLLRLGRIAEAKKEFARAQALGADPGEIHQISAGSN